MRRPSSIVRAALITTGSVLTIGLSFLTLRIIRNSNGNIAELELRFRLAQGGRVHLTAHSSSTPYLQFHSLSIAQDTEGLLDSFALGHEKVWGRGVELK